MPIAIVGIGCRFPGDADTPERFWRNLADGVDAVGEVPADRWRPARSWDPRPGIPGRTFSRWGGFLGAVDRFEPERFGISPREAAHIDPQQRLLLETAWEAIEDAGARLEDLSGTAVGVFVGVCTSDFANLQSTLHDMRTIGAFTATGGAASIAANRLSYCFNLKGPSVAVDTACSSSLVALHLACESLRRGECAAAFAGGANVILTAGNFVAFSAAGMLSPTGRCRAFDAAADGFVRGEGAGMVLLKPLDAALADGDRVYAVIAATGVNQDGRTAGISVPDAAAQEALVVETCRRAGIDPASVQYFEAHGTGTAVGDPIEATALGRALGAARPVDDPCVLGSVKSGIGHLEAAAGIAGLVKTALAIHHRRIPASLHVTAPNPKIPFETLRLRLADRLGPWPHDDRPLVAGVNSFGFGGTNAHALLREAPATATPAGAAVVNGRDAVSEPSAALPFVLSARDAESLQALARETRDRLAGHAADPRDLSWSSCARRSRHDQALSLPFTDVADLVRSLDAFLAGERVPGMVSLRRPPVDSPVVFALCGQGPQSWGMGRKLFDADPVFRDALVECDRLLGELADWSLLEELNADESRSRLHRTAWAQPALFAIQVALARFWEARGIVPAAVVGHSLGEIAAAHIAGLIPLREAVRVVFHRGRAMDLVPPKGRMLAAGLSPAEAEELVARVEGRATVAADNSPRSVTFSGDPDALEILAAELESRGAFHRALTVEYAFHSHHMEPVRDEVFTSLAGAGAGPGRIPMFSTVTGRAVRPGEITVEHWWSGLRDRVRFAEAIDAAAAEGYTTFLEIGPHPVLAGYIGECLRARRLSGAVLPSLRRGEDDTRVTAGTLGALSALGHRPPAPGRRFVRLPGLPWRRERYWHESPELRGARLDAESHPFLHRRLDTPEPTWRSPLDARRTPWLGDHRVEAHAIFPAAGYLDLAASAALRLGGGDAVELEQVQFHRALAVPEEDANLELSVRIDPAGAAFAIASGVPETGGAWTVHAGGTAAAAAGSTMPAAIAVPDDGDEVDPDALYARFTALGLPYGAAFRGVRALRRGAGWAAATVALPDGLAIDGHTLHPALLDAAFQVVLGALDEPGGEGLALPVAVERAVLRAAPERAARVRVRVTHRDRHGLRGDLDLDAEDGTPLARLRGFTCRAVERARAVRADDPRSWVFAVRWEETPMSPPSGDATGVWLVLADREGTGRALAEALRARGGTVEMVEADGAVAEGVERAAGRGPIRGVAHLGGLDVGPPNGDSPETLRRAAAHACHPVLALARALAEAHVAGGLRIALATRGAQAVTGFVRPLAVGAAPLLGLGRVLMSERPELRVRLVDLDARDAGDAVAILVDELLSDDPEEEVAHRGGTRRAPRAERPGAPTATAAAVLAADGASMRLVPNGAGALDRLAWREERRRPPASGEVEIAVEAAGLNFRDVLKALALYPVEPGDDLALGDECAGRVVAVGAGVTSPRPGDRVFAMARGSFASHATVPATTALPIPDGFTATEAAALPVAFLTAHYALRELARIGPGETVLVQAGAGGVGMAAIQVALDAGARVFATAGNPEKRALLKSLGVEAVMDSRSLAFAEEARELTGGRGVDVVLNSLAGRAIAKGMAALAPFGRFLELGKRDIYQNSALGLRAFRYNVAFHSVDVGLLARERPELLSRLFAELRERFADGRYRPLPVTAFPASRAMEAFRTMAQGRHTGKLALTLDDPDVTVERRIEDAPTFRPDGTYLITGGFGGFGLATAAWIVAHGGRHVALLGRRGAADDEARSAVARLEAEGAVVYPLAADVTDPRSLGAALDALRSTEPPLRGVFHAAMHLDDGILAEMTPERFDRVLDPKTAGTWNLHALTRNDPVEHFVLYGSVSSWTGTPGQSNYVAANAFLDAFAHHRRAMGLPALVVDWGRLDEVGYVARHREVAEILTRRGFLGFTPAQAMEGLGRMMARGDAQLGFLRADFGAASRILGAARLPRRVAGLFGDGAADPAASTGTPLRDRLRDASPADREAMLLDYVAVQAARVLGAAADRIDRDRPLAEVGFDSLMAVELKNHIDAELGFALPARALTETPTVRGVAAALGDALTSRG